MSHIYKEGTFLGYFEDFLFSEKIKLFIFLIILNIIDIILTDYGLIHGFEEGSFFYDYLFTHVGILNTTFIAILLKTFFIFIMGIYVFHWERHENRDNVIYLIINNLMFIWLCFLFLACLSWILILEGII